MRRSRIFSFINPDASHSGIYTIRPPLPSLKHLVAIRVRMEEILRAGAKSLATTCPQLKSIELHAESRDFEGPWFEPIIIIAADSSRRNTRHAKKEEEKLDEINMARNLFADLQDMGSTLALRRSARIWQESLTLEFLVTTRWYAEIQHLSGLQEATLMLTQHSDPWEGHTLAEDNTFSWNLWKIRWMVLMSATRLKSRRLDLALLSGHGEGDLMSRQRLRERGGGEGHGEWNGEGHSEMHSGGDGGGDDEGDGEWDE
jgi:hypothetical protein